MCVLGSLRSQEPELEGTLSPGEALAHELPWQMVGVFERHLGLFPASQALSFLTCREGVLTAALASLGCGDS